MRDLQHAHTVIGKYVLFYYPHLIDRLDNTGGRWLPGYPPDERGAQRTVHDFIVLSFEPSPSTSATLYFPMAGFVSQSELVEELQEEIPRVTWTVTTEAGLKTFKRPNLAR
jgi:hypothetical protein